MAVLIIISLGWQGTEEQLGLWSLIFICVVVELHCHWEAWIWMKAVKQVSISFCFGEVEKQALEAQKSRREERFIYNTLKTLELQLFKEVTFVTVNTLERLIELVTKLMMLNDA